MPSFQISLTRHDRAAGRFIAVVRRALQKALAEEHKLRGATQASIAAGLDVNRSVIHRQLMGTENLTIGQVARIAEELGREPAFYLPRKEAVGNQPNPLPEIPQRDRQKISSTGILAPT